MDELNESAESKILTSSRKDGPTYHSGKLSTGPSDPSEKWLLALEDKNAGLYTTSSNICFVDVHSRGDMNLIIIDMGNGFNNIKMNVYRGGSLQTQLAIIDVPSATVPFFMDSGEAGRTPAIAVASGHYLYIYKSLKPFYKFQLPSLPTNQTEIDAWNQVKEDKIDVETLKEILSSISEQADEVPLTSRSRKLLTLQSLEEMNNFVNTQKSTGLKRTTVITCMATIKRSVLEEDALSCLVVGTENREIYFIESEAFTVLCNYSLPSVPVFIDVSGLFDVEFRLIVSCRDASIYVVKRGSKNAKQVVQLISQPVGLVICNSSLIVGCMDRSLSSYSCKGNLLWTVQLTSHILTIESIEIEMLASSLVAVALDNKQVHIFHDKHHVDVISTADNITSMRFGKYGRETATLVMVSQSGALTVMILKRTVKFMPFEVDAAQFSAGSSKLLLPKKTKLFVEQAVRERCEAFCKSPDFIVYPVVLARTHAHNVTVLRLFFLFHLIYLHRYPSSFPTRLVSTEIDCSESFRHLHHQLSQSNFSESQ